MASEPRRRRMSIIAVVVVVILAAGAVISAVLIGAASPSTTGPHATPAQLGPGDHTVEVRVQGRTRIMIVHIPTSLGEAKAPVLLVFHGAGDTAAATAKATDFERVAGQDGLIVAFLQGYQNTWNEGAGHTPAEQAGIDDVAFTAVALTTLEQVAPVDRKRVGAVGFSNGGLLAEYLGCRLASRLSLIVAVSGPLPKSVSRECAPSGPISVLAIHGTADQAIPYGGGPFPGVGGGTTVLSAPASIARWAALNRCATHTKSTPSHDVRIIDYSGCANGVKVRLRTLVGAGHSWPSDVGAIAANALVAP